ncbi:uncharacterized protein LOC124451252 [Xenia sp. Carnegie-2017]|uniref:uncharacterized protein LOC124451252 n=1 Tax=Xenia sp. Carnegie-2017 TaxID=2897299 RepID=UPI001F041381|nr:uncharacterized protein LOC124451252 [Xenia sp. Carnegie-2017]
MIKCQSLNVPPWKVVAWFPIVIDILEDIRIELKRLKDGDVVKPAEKLLPRLAKHWQELTKEVEECLFQGIQVYEGWLARSPNDCLDGLYQLTEDNPMCLASRYKNIKIDNITKLEAVFDIEGLIKLLYHFSHANGRIKVSRAGRHLWDLHGKREFADFFKNVCQLPHVMQLLDDQPLLKLLPHNSDSFLEQFQETVMRMVWEGLGNCRSYMFIDEKDQPVTEFEKEQLISLNALRILH